MTLEEYCEKLYDEPIMENSMQACRAVFTIVDDEDAKMMRTEVIEMKFLIEDGSNMLDAMIKHLSEVEADKAEASESKIIIN